MDFDDIDDECGARRQSLTALLADFKEKRAMTFELSAEKHDGSPEKTVDENVVILSRHLEKLRFGGLRAPKPDIGIVDFTCSSAAVMAILDMLSEMFQ